MNEGAHKIERKELFGHPMGLYILFFTELWERFSYYGMRAILVLYIISSVSDKNPGLGWEESDALALYGWYTMLVYVMSIPGGIIADKWLGQKKTVLYGGLLLCAGHGILAVEQMWAFYTGLILIVLGVGGLKPNISTMVGGLYGPGDDRRDKGFTIFYIGINIGALASSLLVGYIGETIGWHYGFGLAGIGMALGQIVYMAGQKYLEGIGEKPESVIKTNEAGEEEMPSNMLKQIFEKPLSRYVTLAIIALGVYLIAVEGIIGYGILTIALSFGIGVIMVIYQDITQIERDRMTVILISFLIVIVFWGAFEQAGGLMNIYTKQKINRVVMGYEIPASAFQAVNAAFIILFGTAVANFWVWWKHRGKESSSILKMSMGTIIMGIGFIFMAIASQQAGTEVGAKGMLIFLILAYLFHTLGELSASPVALSFITKLAPAKYVSIMMGFYFAATGLGNKLAGAIGESAQAEPIKVEVKAEKDQLTQFVADTTIENGHNFELHGDLTVVNQNQINVDKDGQNLSEFIVLDEENIESIRTRVNESDEKDLTAVIKFEQDEEKKKEVDAPIQAYKAEVEIFELENDREFSTFMLIFAFTAGFGILLIMFLKKLKKLTHGAEDTRKGSAHEEQEGFEVADKEDDDK
jgi:POT family proton-dependent oligopeptide transporter